MHALGALGKAMASASSSSASTGVPPGFRFHPTDEELLLYYLNKKVSLEKFELEVVREVDLNKIEPWDLQGTCDRCVCGDTITCNPRRVAVVLLAFSAY